MADSNVRHIIPGDASAVGRGTFRALCGAYARRVPDEAAATCRECAAIDAEDALAIEALRHPDGCARCGGEKDASADYCAACQPYAGTDR